MSQAKVDKYKEEKANRKKTLAKNKVKRTLGVIAGWVVVVLVVAWIGVSSYKSYQAKQPIPSYYVNADAISEFYDYIDGEDTEEAEDEDTEEGEDTEAETEESEE